MSSTCPGAGRPVCLRCLASRVHGFDAPLIMTEDEGHGARRLARGAGLRALSPLPC